MRGIYLLKRKKGLAGYLAFENLYFYNMTHTLKRNLVSLRQKQKAFKPKKPQSQLAVPYKITVMANLQRWQSHRRLSVTTLAAPSCCDSNLSMPKADMHTNKFFH